MIKIQPIVRNIVLGEIEAYYALANGFMNMSSYAYRIRPEVEELTKKQVTINSLVVSLSRLRAEFKKEKPLIRDVPITNITTKLPLSEIVYENTTASLNKLDSLQKELSAGREDFSTATIGTTEINIIASASMEKKILKHFSVSPKIINRALAAICISFDNNTANIPGTFLSLISIPARAGINVEELVSTYSELIFIVAEKDFGKTVSLFSDLHKATNELKK